MRYLELIRLALEAKVTAEKQCRAADRVTNFADSATRRSGRSLQQLLSEDKDLEANAPFYAMQYTALTRLLLDYRLQEAGYQFCKFYEFRNGGVAPPMCGDGIKYFHARADSSDARVADHPSTREATCARCCRRRVRRTRRPAAHTRS
ncbi:hypothetical protein PINS_up016067 [Pythium insidiosum]|nr:hypothetical protein PINS_up016067 [Pythium insidiosum]